MREKYFDTTIILDRSGSMASIKSGTISGINAFIKEQKEVPGDGCWTMIQFDDKYEVHYAGTPQSQVPLLNDATYQPRGNTALIDAVCRAIHETISRLADLPEEEYPSGVIFVIMTDGIENWSRIYKKSDMAALIKAQNEKYNWQFIFLGANQDSIPEAAQYGIKADGVMNYAHTPTGSDAVLRCASAGVVMWKNAVNAGEQLTSGGIVLEADDKELSKDAITP
jgi:hypothetical protein